MGVESGQVGYRAMTTKRSSEGGFGVQGNVVEPGSYDRSSIVLLPITHCVSGEEIVTYNFKLTVTRGSNWREGHRNICSETSFQDPEMFERYYSCVLTSTHQ